MKNKIKTHADIYAIINPIIDLDLSVEDLKTLADVLLEEAFVLEEEIRERKAEGEE